MNKNGIMYSEASPVWSKSTVKRVLDNKKYIEGKLPGLISSEDFNKTQSLKAGRCNQADTVATPDSKLLRNMVFCADCGGRLTCRKNSGRSTRWYCWDGPCEKGGYVISDEKLIQGIIRLLNQIIADPNIIMPVPAKKAEETLEAIKLRNAFRQEMSKSDADRVCAKNLLMTAAAERYSRCRENDTTAAETLYHEFKNSSFLTEVDMGLVLRSVKRIWITKSSEVRLELITGRHLQEETTSTEACAFNINPSTI